MSTRVRFAPSPTGNLHIGGFRTALFNYFYAKQTSGKIILRIEDTDQSRQVDKAVENLIKSFELLDVNFDEGPHIGGDYGPYIQSHRLDIYKQKINLLLKKRMAYYCFCDSDRLEKLRKKLTIEKKHIKYDRKCLQLSNKEIQIKLKNEKHVIRMKIPDNQHISFHDVVRDKITVKSKEIDDQIIMKSDGFPTYHFANVVDDHLMGITHVMRGEEWLPSTPKHILLYNFFEWGMPKFIHLPLILNSDKSKLSKRQGDVSVQDYIEKGYLSESIINFIALLGWHPNSDEEMFSLQKLEKNFSLKRIQKSGAVFNIQKLDWLNSKYLINLSLQEVVKRAKPFFIKKSFDIADNNKLLLVVDSARKRVNTLAQIVDESKIFYQESEIDSDSLAIILNNKSQSILIALVKRCKKNNMMNGNDFKNLIADIGEEKEIKGKDLFFPIRIALYGNTHGPDLPILFSILGHSESLKRLQKYITL